MGELWKGNRRGAQVPVVGWARMGGRVLHCRVYGSRGCNHDTASFLAQSSSCRLAGGFEVLDARSRAVIGWQGVCGWRRGGTREGWKVRREGLDVSAFPGIGSAGHPEQWKAQWVRATAGASGFRLFLASGDQLQLQLEVLRPLTATGTRDKYRTAFCSPGNCH